MAPRSSTLAWKIPWMEEPGRLQWMGSWRVGQNWGISLSFSLSCIGEGNGNPLQCSCLENPRDGGAWWAAVCGVAQSRTRLKRLSSINLFLFFFFFKFYFIFKLYIIVLVLPNIKMNPPQVYMCSPSWTLLPPHSIPLSQCRPSAPAPSIQYRALNLDWQLGSYMIFYMFQCHSPKSSHPLPLSQSP